MKLTFIVALLAASAAMPASAAILPTSFTFNVTGGAVGSGILDVVSTGSNYQITGISGTFNGNAITGIVNPGEKPVIDNVLIYPGSVVLTTNGFGFRTGSTIQEIWYNAGMGAYRTIQLGGSEVLTVGFSVSPVTASVPEPATWGLLIGGFGLVGAGMRRHRRVAVRFT